MRGNEDIPTVLNELRDVFNAEIAQAGANALAIICQTILSYHEKQGDNSTFILQNELHYFLNELKNRYHHPVADYYEVITQFYSLDENCTEESQAAARIKLQELCNSLNSWALKYVLYG